MVFRALLYLKHISNQEDILQGEALARVVLEKRKINI